MSMIVNTAGWRFAIRLTLAGSVVTVLAGCSQDTSRFSDPFSNPFAGSARISGDPDSKTTGGLANAAPVGEVKSAPLLPARTSALQTAPMRAHPNSVVTERTSAPPNRSANNAGGANWSIEGGTPVVVGENDSLASLSRRYGVPTDALLNVNGLSSASMIRPGTHLVIPVYNAPGGSAPTGAPAAGAKLADRRATHKTQATLRPPEPIAKHPPQVKTSDVAKLVPPAKTGATMPVPPAAALAPAPKSAAKHEEIDPTPTASLAPTPTPSLNTIAPDDKLANNPEFRWPVRGRVIQAFKSGANDGINIAVPEGTSVKAAENGTVVYAGSELKGYGNLVLIRHPNGFTTAYANNGEISVKRGDQVKRGQIIAKSGQSGNVASPQLHFELRKGSTPIDPSNYLAGL
jgi:murein DD-endopeptidase MepM/ murein hydrolase activator NlpD